MLPRKSDTQLPAKAVHAYTTNYQVPPGHLPTTAKQHSLNKSMQPKANLLGQMLQYESLKQ
jgi:hypothetical protein